MAKRDSAMRSQISLGVIIGAFCTSLSLWAGPSFGQKPQLCSIQGPTIGVETVDAESMGDQQTDIIVGEIIVKFERTMTIAEGISKLQEAFNGNGLEKMSEISVINAAVLRTNIYELYKNGTIDKEEAQQRTLDLIQQIQSYSFVEGVEPNEEVIERFPYFIEAV